MNTKLGKWMMGYGAFLVAMGLVGYLSNPAKATTALISGGVFGGLSVLWGILLARGQSWSRWAALATTGLLTAVFAWRASVSWAAFSEGQPEKWVRSHHHLGYGSGLAVHAGFALGRLRPSRCAKSE